MTSTLNDRYECWLEEAMSLSPSERHAFVEDVVEDIVHRERLRNLILAAEKAPEFFDGLSQGISSPMILPPIRPGEKFGHYRILQQLGAGGMGIVYLAEDLKLRRQVALKFLPPHMGHDSVARSRFLNEARLSAKLNHPNVATVYDSGQLGDQIYIAMEYVEGETLRDRIKDGPLTIDEAISITIQIGEGLLAAHCSGIVHRDVKPGNVMIDKNGSAKIMDFGLAKLRGVDGFTKTGSAMGTVAYMSPEQARSDTIDHRTDIWSLGVVLYEMLTAERPFSGDHEQIVIYNILNESVENVRSIRPSVPDYLAKIILKTLAKKARDRYLDLQTMLVDLNSKTITQRSHFRNTIFPRVPAGLPSSVKGVFEQLASEPRSDTLGSTHPVLNSSTVDDAPMTSQWFLSRTYRFVGYGALFFLTVTALLLVSGQIDMRTLPWVLSKGPHHTRWVCEYADGTKVYNRFRNYRTYEEVRTHFVLEYRTEKTRSDCNSYFIESPDVHRQLCNTIESLEEFERTHGQPVKIYMDSE